MVLLLLSPFSVGLLLPLAVIAGASGTSTIMTTTMDEQAAKEAMALSAFQRISKVCSTCLTPVAGGGLRAVNGSSSDVVKVVPARTAGACAAACLTDAHCISFNFAPSAHECELNHFTETYVVANVSFPSQYWLRREQPGAASAAAAPSRLAIPYHLAVPTSSVTLAPGGRFALSMEISMDYLLRNYDVDNMLWWFRWRRQGMTGQSPPGQPQGWDRCTDNLRKEAGKLCLKGSVASTFLMGAGGILRWPSPCCSVDSAAAAAAAGVREGRTNSSTAGTRQHVAGGAVRSGGGGCCAQRKELKRRFELVLEGIENCTLSTGFAAAFAGERTRCIQLNIVSFSHRTPT
jgi:hypothetical protein